MRKVALLVGVMAGTIGVLSVCTGRANIKGGIRPILRSEHPFFFWTIVGVWFCGSVWSFYNGFKKEKKMKPNQASEDTARKFSDPPR